VNAAALLAGLHPQVKERAELCLSWAVYYGLTVTLTSGTRSIEEQKKLRERYERCLKSPGGVYPGNPNPECRYPANKPGDSAHNFGMAWDSSVPANQLWAWTYLRQYAGFRVPENDQVHAEVPNWRDFV
jgi:hypothetical protein